MFLVATLSDRWNWYLTQEPTGKVVWCELHVQQSNTTEDSKTASHTSLPRRIAHAQHVAPAKAMDDPFTLRRVRDGLRELDYARTVIPAHTGGTEDYAKPHSVHNRELFPEILKNPATRRTG